MSWKVTVSIFAAVFAVGMAVMTGAPVDANVNEEGVQNALKFAVVQHNKKSNDMYLSQVAQVIRAQKQVVAGTKYIITVQMGKTPCRKNGAEETCAIHADPEMARPYQCTFTVWSRPWLPAIELLKQTCP
ncbi:cystatin C (amyloid angiopathy and cerebral hemorrhage) [Centroberyx gerrardi]|uniref:cystatin C (amyloid angiopathy and cerebral hemorrhage) n=1 Tax=Centroberyx gerrardi TaxID=166262 RepID=UPI003AAD31D7